LQEGEGEEFFRAGRWVVRRRPGSAEKVGPGFGRSGKEIASDLSEKSRAVILRYRKK